MDLGSRTEDRGPRTEDRERPVDRSVDRSVDQSVGDAVDAVDAITREVDFGAFASAVVGLCRAAASPDAVAGVLRLHLAGGEGYERGTPAQVGNACQHYAANGEAFNSALFAGFLRRAKRARERVVNRERNGAEAQRISVETAAREAEASDEAATAREIAAFKNAHPGQYAALIERAELEVPATITMGRAIIVREQMRKMIREAAA